ncbi:hypothetical protein NQZ79_g6176 [Umbelopsis isabellina]|nr:hypothetical protein NQZ79_g6176 [Umbelopsis isabellina]
MRSLLYISTLVLAGALVNAAPVPYNPNAPAVSQDIENLFQYISSKDSGANMSEKQQIEQDIATLQGRADTNSQEYRTALDTFWSDLGGLWVKYPEWSGWSTLQSDITQEAWSNIEKDQHINDVSTASSTVTLSFDSDLDDLEVYVKEHDVASISDVYIIKQAILWLKIHEHNINTAHDFVEQATNADEAWGRLQKNNPNWPNWTQAEQDFKNDWSQTLQDVSNTTLPNLYAEENPHSNGVQYEELSSFFEASNHPNAGVEYEDLKSFFDTSSHSNTDETTPDITDLDELFNGYFSESDTAHTNALYSESTSTVEPINPDDPVSDNTTSTDATTSNEGVDMDAYIDDVFAKLAAPDDGSHADHIDGLAEIVESWNQYDSH